MTGSAVHGGAVLRIAEAIMRVLSYLFHLLLGMALLGLSLVALLSQEASFKIGILPWEGAVLAYVLLASGVVAIVTVCLATKRISSIGLLLWSAAVLVMVVRGYVFTPFSFGRDGPTIAYILVLGAAIALVGSWIGCRRKPAVAKPLVAGGREGD
jgi:hypothetical protein